MANCKILLNDGSSNILLNDGSSVILLNDDTCSDGPTPTPTGGTGGRTTRVRKTAGKQLISDNLGNRPTIIAEGQSRATTVLYSRAKSRSKLIARTEAYSKAKNVPFLSGKSISKLNIPTNYESVAKLYYIENSESWGILHPSVASQRLSKEANEMRAYAKLMTYMNMLESIDKMYVTNTEASPKIKSFEFSEKTNNEELIAFTHSSSFVGNVRYNTETQEMRILLNGKAYNFCGVPQRIYESFQGADSKGAFFNRSIKTQFDC